MRILFGVVGVLFLVGAIVQQWDNVRDQVVFSVPRTAFALGLVIGSVVALAVAWQQLLPTTDPVAMRRVFYLAQPAKYVPGGVAQPLGQVALTADQGVPVAAAATAFLVHAVASAVAGAVLGSAFVFVTGGPGWIRALAALGVLAPMLLWRPVFTTVIGLAARILRRDPASTAVPSQAAIVRAFVLAVIGIALTAGAFGTLGGDEVFAGGPVQLAIAFALAWTVGYLAVPFPSGLGIREAVLALLLTGTTIGTIAALSAVHRFVTMLAELVLVVFSRRR